MQPDKSSIFTVPAPVGGWNARDSISEMPEIDALVLENAFPESQYIRFLGEGISSTLAQRECFGAVETLVEHVRPDGRTLAIVSDEIAFRLLDENCNEITPLYGIASHFSGSRWQHVQFRSFSVLVNGAGQPWLFNGETDVTGFSPANYSGISDPSTLVNVDVYKSRLYFVQKDSLSIWYGEVNEVQGALIEFDISGVVRKGGRVILSGSLTHDLRSGLNDLFIIVTSQGEILAYSGDNPGASNWQLNGRFFVGRPLEYRCATQFVSDMLIATTEGIISVADVIQNSQPTRRFSDKIQLAYNAAIQSSNNSFEQWSLTFCAARHMLVLMVPVQKAQALENLVNDQIWLMNTNTGAWCNNVNSRGPVCVLKNRVISIASYPSSTRFPDYIFPPPVLDTFKIKEIGSSQNALHTVVDIQSAYSSFGDRGSIKSIKSIKPYFVCNGDIEAVLQVYGDFANSYSKTTSGANNTVIVASGGGTRWGSPWGASWAAGGEANPYFYSVETRTGVFFSYRILISNSQSAAVSSQFTSLSYLYEPGGII